jgi:hydroxypyruvate isomerase
MPRVNRRVFLTGVAATPIVTAVAAAQSAPPRAPLPAPRKGRLKQSVMRTAFAPNTSFDEMCRIAKEMGFDGFDLTGAQDWPTLKKYGLVPSLVTASTGTTFENGLIRKELHDKFEQGFKESIDKCVEIGAPNLIAIPGQRRGMSYEEAAENCVAILNRVKKYAEDKAITLCIEITNLRDRPDQVFNRLDWGFDVVKRVASPRVKVVFDIYHAQITDGDVTRHIRDNIAFINHFHTAGVPGRNEIDDTQELNYHFIAKAIADTGYTGFIAHEYRPSMGRDPLQSLAQARDICTV